MRIYGKYQIAHTKKLIPLLNLICAPSILSTEGEFTFVKIF